jgi:hypothetical protein
MRLGAKASLFRRFPSGRDLLAAALLALFAACGLLLALAPADAAAALPAAPVAKKPQGTVSQPRPTFTWSKAADAVVYEVRVYQGSQQLVKKSGITSLSWTSTRTLPANVALNWKVRGINAQGAGAWSARRSFMVGPGGSANKITSFRFAELEPVVKGTINQGLRTIKATVPFGTDLRHLVATFSTTAVKVKVGGVLQESGVSINDFSGPVIYRAKAADGSSRDYTVTVRVGENLAECAITSFGFVNPAVQGVVREDLKRIDIAVPAGTDVTSLVATFAATPGAVVTVRGGQQTSGVTVNDFSQEVLYQVIAPDHTTTKTYTVFVSMAGDSSPRALTEFRFLGLDPPANGVINEALHTIAVAVSTGTDVTALVATFTTTGVSVTVNGVPQQSGVTANDFTQPVTYRVTSDTGAICDYVVTVKVGELPSSSKTLTSFRFKGISPQNNGVIDEETMSIICEVAVGTDLSNLVAEFTTTGVKVDVGGVTQRSGVTANDFTWGCVYNVTAEDGSVASYTVMVIDSL